MNIQQLAEQLDAIGVPADIYSLDGYRYRRICLEQRLSKWVISFYDGNHELVLGEYPSESDAAKSMLALLRSESWVEKRK